MQDFKQADEQIPPAKRFGCLGWFLVFAVGALLLCGGLCGGAYYAVFHSSLPLAQLEKLLESSGDVEVEGLSGSISSGLRIDRLRTRGEENRWSTYEGISFQFNGLVDVFQSQRLIIQELSVESGEVYVKELPRFEDIGDTSQDPDMPEAEPAESVGEANEIEGLKEVRIDRLQLSNLRFIETTTDAEFTIDKIALDGFQYLNGRVTRLGDVVVTTDDIEFHSGNSEFFADQPSSVVTRKFSGVVRSTIHENIRADISFDTDICFAEDGKLFAHASLFDDKVTYDINRNDQIETVFRDFTLTDYMQWKHGRLPSHVTARMTQGSEDERVVLTIEPGATFQLGELRFEVETRELEADEDAQRSPPILAKHSSSAGEFDCRLYLLENQPYLVVELESGNQKNTPDLFARVFFGSVHESLIKMERESVAKLIKAAKNATKVTEATKPVEDHGEKP